ncbi:MAG: rhodanese-like domain-containing protein [Candidatus Eiseniibacteriota bacterium]
MPVRVKSVGARALRAMILDGAELALLDVREQGVFGRGHLLFASCVPLSRLELMIEDLVPRRSVRLVLCDGGDGLAERAARTLVGLGYTDISVLDGGTEGWRAAGFVLFSGVNVPSKAFGELVEHQCGTPRITATELAAKRDGGEDLVILDSRPWEEYHRMNIPGGIDTPGAELVYRVHDLAPSPSRLVVVNCAGRTRSIIGAQSLINAGIPNHVVALKDGTMGWHLAGLPVEKAAARRAPEPSPEGLAKARAAAARVAKRVGVKTIDKKKLAAWRREADLRTLFLLDVRSPEEYAAGHVPGSRSAPGGQLVQATDEYVGVRNARLVLIDDTGVRATMTASWLIQMGWPEVVVLDGGLAGTTLDTGEDPPLPAALTAVGAEEIDPTVLNEAGLNGTVVVDFADSLAYRAGHVPGAWYMVRARIPEDAKKLPLAERYVATSPDGRLARLAAPELAAATGRPVKTLRGGTAAWRAAELLLVQGNENLASATDDVMYKPYDHERGIEGFMQEYLAWELDLIRQLEEDGTAKFRIVPPTG